MEINMTRLGPLVLPWPGGLGGLLHACCLKAHLAGCLLACSVRLLPACFVEPC